MTKISVVIPVYNGGAHVDTAIQSVLRQHYSDWELIVVDDGSTDDTTSVLSRYSNGLKVLHQTNRGPSAARNNGLRNATGEYVAFLDADDTWDDNFLKIASAKLDTLSCDYVGVCTGWEYSEQSRGTLTHTRRKLRGNIGLRKLMVSNPFPIHAALIRKNAVVDAGGFDEEIYAMEDWDLWLRLTLPGSRFGAIDSCLAQYTLHGISNSSNPDRMRAGRIRTLDKLFDNNHLPKEIAKNQASAYARIYIQNCVEYFAVRRDNDALIDFREAIKYSPDILLNLHVYYDILCATQPIGYKGTSRFLDIDQSEQRMINLLDCTFRDLGSSIIELRDRAYARSFLVLGRLAYGQGQMKKSRGYFARAQKLDSYCFLNGFNALFMIKSQINPKWIEKFRSLKRDQFPSR
jgi:glycosyltransferase involved in cell wall biosynthesis